MAALAERFDPATGECLDANTAEHQRARVSVLTQLEQFDLAPTERAARAKSRFEKRDRTERQIPVPPTPTPTRATPPHFLTIAELEQRLAPDDEPPHFAVDH